MESFERGVVGQGASRNTVTTYKQNLERFVKAFGEKPVEEITASDLHEHLHAARLKVDGAEKTPRTMNAMKTALRSFFKSIGLEENPPSMTTTFGGARIFRAYVAAPARAASQR